MNEKDDFVYLAHILQAIEKIERFAARPREDDAIRDAVERNLAIIGEAANEVSKHVQDKAPEIPWGLIIGFRNKLVHDYFGLEEAIVWDVVDTDLPLLKQHIHSLMKALQ